MNFKWMLRKMTAGPTLKKILERWLKRNEGLAAMEAAMVFPLLLVLLLGVFDLGNAILVNQKAIRASQIAADLVTRARSVDDAMIDEAIEAGRLALSPFSTESFGVDVVSISFDGEDDPQIIWRETRNMGALADILDLVAALDEEGEGIVVVAVEYNFEPVFSGFAVGSIHMREIAFARGRKSAVVERI